MSEKPEQVHHPAHYGGPNNPHETYLCLRAWGLEKDALVWSACKYLSRAGKKGDIVEDLSKAIWYIQAKIDQIKANS